jgi:hypothetical protein
VNGLKDITKKKLTAAIVVALTLATLSGCIFDTRDAEPPGGPASTWVVPNLPSQVFTNMRNGLEDLTGVNYKRSIQDVFTFVPLPEDASNPTLIGAFDNWTADIEKEVIDKLLADASDVEVTFTNIEQIFDQTPFAYFNVDYSLRVIDNSGETRFYKAKAEFRMQDGSKGWQLIQWQDIERVSGFASWGFLRGRLRLL